MGETELLGGDVHPSSAFLVDTETEIKSHEVITSYRVFLEAFIKLS